MRAPWVQQRWQRKWGFSGRTHRRFSHNYSYGPWSVILLQHSKIIHLEMSFRNRSEGILKWCSVWTCSLREWKNIPCVTWGEIQATWYSINNVKMRIRLMGPGRARWTTTHTRVEATFCSPSLRLWDRVYQLSGQQTCESTCPVMGSQGSSACVGAGGSSSGPCTYGITALTTEPSPQPWVHSGVFLFVYLFWVVY